MLIRIFKNNSPLSYIIIPVLALFLWVKGFFGQLDLTNDNMPLFTITQSWFGGNIYIAVLVSVFLLLCGAFLLNFIINENEILGKSSFLPALFYIVFMSSDPTLLTMYPMLFANLFILLAIHRLVNSYRLDTAFSNSFDSGFLLSLASLFYFPCVAFFPALWIGFILFRPFNWREWIIAIIGILVPYSFVFTYYFWNDMQNQLFDITFFYSNPQNVSLGSSGAFYFTLIVFTVILVLSFGKLFIGFSDAIQKNKKGVVLLFWLFLFGLLGLFLSPKIDLKSLSILSIPLVVFSANYFLKLRTAGWGEFLFAMLLGSILIGQLL